MQHQRTPRAYLVRRVTHSTGKPTKAQQARLDAIKAMRCVCCEFEKVQQPWPTEIDHLVDMGNRRVSGGHDATIPLCAWHHRGLQLDGLSVETMTGRYGPSFALRGRLAAVWYGTKRALLATVNARLKVAA